MKKTMRLAGLVGVLVAGCDNKPVIPPMPEVNDSNCQIEAIKKIEDRATREKFAGLCSRRSPSAGGSKAGQGAGSLLVATAANLAQGIGDVAKAKAASIRDAAVERIADTTGGRIAAAIRASSQTDQAVEDVPSFGGNSLAGADSAAADPDDEVATFANRDKEI